MGFEKKGVQGNVLFVVCVTKGVMISQFNVPVYESCKIG